MKRTRYILLSTGEQVWKTPDGPKRGDPQGSRWESVADNVAPSMSRIVYRQDGSRWMVPSDSVRKEKQ